MANEVRLSPILDDRPTDKDALDFSPYRDTLVDIIADPDTRTPLTIGIFGGWGSGKTSLMQMVESRLREVLAERRLEARTVLVQCLAIRQRRSSVARTVAPCPGCPTPSQTQRRH